MKANPLASLWSLGEVMKFCNATQQEIEEAMKRIGAEFCDLTLNGVPYFNVVCAEIIRQNIVLAREQGVAVATAAGAHQQPSNTNPAERPN